MKIIFILIASSLMITPVFSQLEVKPKPKKTTIGKTKNGQYEVELYQLSIDNDTAYVIMYQDMQFQRIVDFKSVSFKDIDGTREKLYELMMSVFSDENEKNKEYS